MINKQIWRGMLESSTTLPFWWNYNTCTMYTHANGRQCTHLKIQIMLINWSKLMTSLFWNASLSNTDCLTRSRNHSFSQNVQLHPAFIELLFFCTVFEVIFGISACDMWTQKNWLFYGRQIYSKLKDFLHVCFINIK